MGIGLNTPSVARGRETRFSRAFELEVCCVGRFAPSRTGEGVDAPCNKLRSGDSFQQSARAGSMLRGKSRSAEVVRGGSAGDAVDASCVQHAEKHRCRKARYEAQKGSRSAVASRTAATSWRYMRVMNLDQSDDATHSQPSGTGVYLGRWKTMRLLRVSGTPAAPRGLH